MSSSTVNEIRTGVKALNDWLEEHIEHTAVELQEKGRYAWNISRLLVGMNDVWPGPGRWRFEKVDAKILQNMVIYEGRFEVLVGEGKDAFWFSTGTQYGGANAKAKGGIPDALKAARSDALKKALQEIGAGFQAYCGLVPALLRNFRKTGSARPQNGGNKKDTAPKNEAPNDSAPSTGNQHADKANDVRAEVLKRADAAVQAYMELSGADEQKVLMWAWNYRTWDTVKKMHVGKLRAGLDKLEEETRSAKQAMEDVDPETGEVRESSTEGAPELDGIEL